MKTAEKRAFNMGYTSAKRGMVCIQENPFNSYSEEALWEFWKKGYGRYQDDEANKDVDAILGKLFRVRVRRGK